MKNSNEPPKPKAGDLELPDWSGMIDSGLLVSPEAAFRFSEEYAARFPEVIRRLQEERHEQRCVVEFVLEQ